MTKRAFGVSMFAAFLLAAMTVWADSQVRIVRLSYVDGPVQLDRGTGEGFDRAILNMPITNGMKLWTKDESRAEVEFEDGTTIRLTPGTTVDFTRLALTDAGNRSTVVTIESGQAYVNYSHKKNEDFVIRAGQSEMQLSKSVQFRINVAQEKADVAVFKGELMADGAKIKKNHTAELNLDNGTYELAKGIAPDSDDTWNRERTDYHNAYMRSAYNGSAYYGLTDLNYYGTWMSSRYGSCWQPMGMNAAFSPYSTGAWVFYPNYGYTFVSLYPWGWLPYRSGSWNYLGASGWCWSPGRTYYGLGWAPVYHAPSGFTPVKPPPTPPANPPTQVTGGPQPRGRGPHGILPVGDIDSDTWRPRHLPPGYGYAGGGFRGPRYRGGMPSGGTTTSGAANVTNSTVERPARGGRTAGEVSPGRRQNGMHDGAQAERGPRTPRMDRPMPSQRMERPAPPPRMERSAPPAPRMSAPAPAPAPRMSAPAPPPAQAPARSGGRPKE